MCLGLVLILSLVSTINIIKYLYTILSRIIVYKVFNYLVVFPVVNGLILSFICDERVSYY